MQIDYDTVDLAFVTRILDENSRRLSRTRAGVSDASSSLEKRQVILEPEDLRKRSAENERKVQRFVFESHNDPPPPDGKAVRKLIWTIADMTNDGLLPTPHKLRVWSDCRDPLAKGVTRINADDLPEALERFANNVSQRWHELSHDPVSLASWAEWELGGGSLHPFYDGCGRIARSFGALLLLRASWVLPLYDNRESYFEHGGQGPVSFSAYLSSRIQECWRWLEENRLLPGEAGRSKG
jgi:hypothetical protein